MKRRLAVIGTSLLLLAATGGQNSAQQQPRASSKRPVQSKVTATVDAGLMPLEARKALVQQYCQGCHNDQTHSGGMTLTALDLAHVDQNPELAEKIIKKL